MRKSLLAASGVGLCAVLVASAAPAAAAEPAEIVELADNLHLIQLPEVPHTVMLVLTGADGTLLVDYENPDLETQHADPATVARIDAALNRIDARPVRYLINTHWHQDHVGGNRALGDEALIVAHAGARRLLAERQTPWWLPQGVGPMPEVGLPEVTFDGAMTLFLNGEEIELLNFGVAHTEGDAIVWLKHANVVHVGDLFHGFDTLAVGTDMDGIARTYGELLERLPEDVRIVTGHGPVVGRAELERTHAMLTDVLAWMKTAIAEGATPEEIIQQRTLPEPWDDAWPADPEIRKRRVETLHRLLADSAPTDEEALLELHRRSIAAHLARDVDMLMAAEAADSVVSSRGEVSHPTPDERRELFSHYFGSTAFATYRDTIEPIVKVSDDGTLGWVIVQVEAAGEQTGASGTLHPIEFESSWIELYEKRDGEWRRVGNVSNFAPR